MKLVRITIIYARMAYGLLRAVASNPAALLSYLQRRK
jgi:hypothetical protein